MGIESFSHLMSAQPDHPSVRRVVLPSGKTIEVVYFTHDVEPACPAPEPPARADPHTCPACASSLVHPTDWDEAGAHAWRMILRCPNCEWTGDGVFDQKAVERFEDHLDHGTDALMRDLRRLVQANMEEGLDRFVTALEVDAIWPMDF